MFAESLCENIDYSVVEGGVFILTVSRERYSDKSSFTRNSTEINFDFFKNI